MLEKMKTMNKKRYRYRNHENFKLLKEIPVPYQFKTWLVTIIP
jgi:hypothetical protein